MNCFYFLGTADMFGDRETDFIVDTNYNLTTAIHCEENQHS